jgi:hypothetical protein
MTIILFAGHLQVHSVLAPAGSKYVSHLLHMQDRVSIQIHNTMRHNDPCRIQYVSNLEQTSPNAAYLQAPLGSSDRSALRLC